VLPLYRKRSNSNGYPEPIPYMGNVSFSEDTAQFVRLTPAPQHHERQFDVVIDCDNTVPHLLSDAALLAAFQAFYQCARSGSGCLMSVRDYAQEDCTGLQAKAYEVRLEGSIRYVLFQVWKFEGLIYD
jgi:hypothetical protein